MTAIVIAVVSLIISGVALFVASNIHDHVGATGERGATGAKGPQGDTGPIGEHGATGATGMSGQAASKRK